jgi:purine catabolism regulator
MGERPVALGVLRSATPPLDDHDVLRPQFDVVPLMAAVDDDLLLVLPAGWSAFDEFRRTLPAAPLGMSGPLAPGASLREAHLQARTAADRAAEAGVDVVFYDDLDDLGGISPRSLSEMRRLVDRVLRPLIDHDRASGGELLASLELFLRNDRSWTRTADGLGVHRQTLVYRLGQVERLTGCKPTSTEGIATLWLALQAAQTTGVLDKRR